MKIGIIGAGKIGGTLGPLWHRAGHEVFFGSRHPEELTALVAGLGARAKPQPEKPVRNLHPLRGTALQVG